ncbi:MAG: TolC family protein [Candidatus Rokubacteria bacterium]|nr:TolC family protein [Candidatus Rokubacteria bacterium]
MAPLGLLLVLAALVGAARPVAAQAPSAPSPRSAPAPGQVLTLPEAIALALRQHPSIRAAQQGRTAAETRVPQAQSAYFPTLDWLSSANRSRTFFSSIGRGVTSTLFSTGVEGRQLLFDFGRTGALVEEARANFRATDAELERVRQAVVLNVRQSYLVLLQARRLVGVAEASLQRAELNLRSARGFFEVGTKPKSDVTRAEVDVANARVSVIRARNAVRLAETSLANALGLDTTPELELQDILAFTPALFEPQALLQEAFRNRPELAQARARLEAARAQLAGARAAFGPELSASAAYGGSSAEFPLEERWAVGLQLSWNLFQGGFTINRLRETEALVETAQANAETLELQVRTEVEQSHINVVEAAERITATEKAVESARENLRLAQGRYDAGVGTILDLTDAQLSLSAAEADQVRALTDHQVGLAVLERAIGRE